MSKKIVAIGGGLNGRKLDDGSFDPYETGPMDQEIIRLTGKDKPNFLFIAHTQSTQDGQDKYFVTMKNIYEGRYGCECRHLRSKDLYDSNKVSELIEWADIIYEGGGNTLDMIALWNETGFDKVLREAWENGKVMCGVSAGANCWFKECSSDSLQIKYGKDQPLIGVDCIGLVDGLFVPHCDEPGRAENVKDLLLKSSEIGLSISNCCALEIIDDEYRLITSTPIAHEIKPYGLKTYWEDGEYIIETIDDGLNFKPLNELLTRNNRKKKM
jgi:dipeptidase E